MTRNYKEWILQKKDKFEKKKLLELLEIKDTKDRQRIRQNWRDWRETNWILKNYPEYSIKEIWIIFSMLKKNSCHYRTSSHGQPSFKNGNLKTSHLQKRTQEFIIYKKKLSWEEGEGWKKQ